ncbi:MAG TPA: molybdopterin-dependent oxidoreductase [Acidimicrobiales bacterium]|nr:molybdopterin-dependent oxidoreductase [Acidimicrobiales bacterium]
MATDDETHFRTCPLCEATCGLEITTRGDEVVRIRGDRDDVFSHRFICPKGSTIKDLDVDPDRVRRPLVRDGEEWREVTWDEAFAEIERRMRPILDAGDRDGVAIYLGNPTVHNVGANLYVGQVARAIGSRNVYSASTLDQMPKQVSAAMMFGTIISVPVPDLDRTSYLLMLGADPYESNGSLCTAPDFPGRLEAIQARGGKVVVVDPRRSKTARHASEHLAILPGGDTAFLLGVLAVMVEDGLVDTGAVGPYVNGLADVEDVARRFPLDALAGACGIDTATIRRLAHELCAADGAAVYGRIGTCTQEFGTLASWLVDVLNVVTGNLDRPGGAMFATPPVGGPTTRGTPGTGKGVTFGRWTSRVRGLPEAFGELPATTLPDEIETPGPGQVRALVTIAGNPVLSNPDSGRLDAALATLECVVSVDMYVNETTRHAHVILPATRILARPHFDVAFSQLAVRNVANWSPAIFALDEDEREEWEVLLRLALLFKGLTAGGTDTDVAAADEALARHTVEAATRSPMSIVAGRDPDELLETASRGGPTGTRRGPARLIDIQLRTGPYGDGFGARAEGLTLEMLEAHPHGVDFGPLVPRVPDVLRTPTGMIELAPAPIVADLDRFEAALSRLAARAVPRNGDGLDVVLVGRRHVRSNNSWMHNVRVLVKGKPRCTLLLHPDDAAALDVATGDPVEVSSGEHRSVVATAEVTDEMRRGVASLPHGWGHDLSDALSVASTVPGVNINRVIPPTLDPLSGTAVLNGVPVTLRPARDLVAAGTATDVAPATAGD